MKDDIVDYNVMHTMTCRIMNSMQQFLININYYFSQLFIIFHIFHKSSFPNYSFKMLTS